MPWSTTRAAGTAAKYRTPEHRRERAKYVRQMERDGYLVCQQPICLMPSRVIQRGQLWHLGHDATGTTYIGPVCAHCNRVDGAKRGNARSRGVTDKPRRWVL